MCEWGKNTIVHLCRPLVTSKRLDIGVDSCIADLVQALNDAKIETTYSCCGHNKGDGLILLAKGRELIIRKGVVMPKRDLQKRVMTGYLPTTWDLRVMDYYSKKRITTVSTNKYGTFGHFISPEKLSNSGDEVKVRVTIEEV